MAWQGRIIFNEPMSQPPESGRWETDYKYNTFVLTEDNSLLAVGLNTGDKEKVTEVNGDLEETRINRYSDEFIPIQAAEYSVENNMMVLGRLVFGMSIDEVEDILGNAGIHTFRVEESVNERYSAVLSAEYNQYHCYFDNQNKLVRISIQKGGSRDGRFTLGMSFSDLQKRVEEAGGSFAEEESDTPYEIWLYQDEGQQIRYEFSVYEGSVSVVDEVAINGQT